nr:hypothetical protein [Nocardiopsis sp. MG754419]
MWRGLAVAAAVFGAPALLGAALGPLWWWLAPRPELTALGQGEVFAGASEDVFAGEGYFVLITAVAGLVTGYACYMIQFALASRREQDLRLPLLLAGFLGAVTAATLVWRVGLALDGPARDAILAAEPGDTVTGALQLQALAFLIVWPFVHVLQYGLLDGISLLRADQPGVPEPEPRPDLTSADAPEDPTPGAGTAERGLPEAPETENPERPTSGPDRGAPVASPEGERDDAERRRP